MNKSKINIENEFTPEQLAGWEEYRQALYIQKSKSDDLFEKAITFISSGALALTLTFHDKIVPVENAIFVLLIALGWAFLVGTLFVNLISHYQSSKSIDISIDEIDGIIDNQLTYTIFNKNLRGRNGLIDILNKISIGLLGIGLILIIIYVSINIQYGKTGTTGTKVQTAKSTTTKNQHLQSERTVDTTSYISIK